MTVFRLVLAVALVALGTFMVLGRQRIAARHVRRRGRTDVPPTGWAVLGVMLAVAGLAQGAAALASA